MEAFQANRRYLAAIAYRLLGSVTDAEDVVQDAWLRWQTTDRSDIRDPRAFLTTVVTRLCYDELGSARARREAYVGEWLPEPLVTDENSPAERAELREEVSLAMLAVMEQLSPAERIAFVLHDVFSVGFEEIGTALGRSGTAARQLASRGRRRVKGGMTEGASARREIAPDEHRQVVRAFATAVQTGDIPGLLAVLAPDIVWRSDGGGVVSAGKRPVYGSEKVARLLHGLARKYVAGQGVSFAFAEVNGELGLVAYHREGGVMAVVAFTVNEGRVAEGFTVLNPEKLRHLG